MSEFDRRLHWQFKDDKQFEDSFRAIYSELYSSEEHLLKAMKSFDRENWRIPPMDRDFVKDLVNKRLTKTEIGTTPYRTNSAILFEDIGYLVKDGVNILYFKNSEECYFEYEYDEPFEFHTLDLAKNALNKNKIKIKKEHVMNQISDIEVAVKDGIKHYYGYPYKYKNDLLVVADFLDTEDHFKDPIKDAFSENHIGTDYRKLAFIFSAVTKKLIPSRILIEGDDELYIINHLTVL